MNDDFLPALLHGLSIIGQDQKDVQQEAWSWNRRAREHLREGHARALATRMDRPVSQAKMLMLLAEYCSEYGTPRVLRPLRESNVLDDYPDLQRLIGSSAVEKVLGLAGQGLLRTLAAALWRRSRGGAPRA
jgi:hypothetical protein